MTLLTLLDEYRRGLLTRGELAMRLVDIGPEVRAEELRSALAARADLLDFLAEWLRGVGAGADMFSSEGTEPISASQRFAAARLGADLSTRVASIGIRPVAFDRRVGRPHIDSTALAVDHDTFRIQTRAALQ